MIGQATPATPLDTSKLMADFNQMKASRASSSLHSG